MNATTTLQTAIAHDLGLAIGQALRIKKIQGEVAKSARDMKKSANEAIKKGAENKVSWGEGNKRTNVMSKAFDEALGDVSGVSPKTVSNYLSVAKWCFANRVAIQTWDITAQKAKEQIDILTGKPVELEPEVDSEGNVTVIGGGSDKHCVAGFVAMQEKQEGFDEWVNALVDTLGIREIYSPQEMTQALWQAMAKTGHAVMDGKTAQWKAK